MGKGSKQRPGDRQKYNENWEKIFGKKSNIPVAVVNREEEEDDDEEEVDPLDFDP